MYDVCERCLHGPRIRICHVCYMNRGQLHECPDRNMPRKFQNEALCLCPCRKRSVVQLDPNEGYECQVHRYHSPRPKVLVRHHVVPLSWKGIDASSNIVVVCPTGHYNIHDLLNEYVHHQGVPPWSVTSHYDHNERHLAQQAWDNRPDDKPPITSLL